MPMRQRSVLDLVLVAEVDGGLVAAFGGQGAVSLCQPDFAFGGIDPAEAIEGRAEIIVSEVACLDAFLGGVE